jgi:SulP family sulfate permease
MAGALVVTAGALRLGRAVSFIPWPVIEGFTLGIAIIIFAQQIPFLTSATPEHGGAQPANAILAAVHALLTADPFYLAWSAGAVAIVALLMTFAARIHPAVPGSLLGILVVTAITLLMPSPLAPIGALPAAIPTPVLPSLDPATVTALAPAAVAVAALAAIESLLSARVAGSLADTGRFDPDRELIGQGVASIGSALVGGMPATGAIARTAVNVRSGGRSRLAAIVHAGVLAAILLAAAEPVGRLPVAALAAVLMVTAVRMVQRETVRSILRSTRADAAAFVITALITVSFDLIAAVLIGVAFAGIVAVRGLARSTGVRREPIPGEPLPGDELIAVMVIDGPLFFAGSQRVTEELGAIDGVAVTIIRMSRLELVDATGARAISDIVHSMERRGVTVLLSGVRPGHEELFRSVGVLSALRDHRHLFAEFDAAVEHARSHVRRAAPQSTT